VGDANTGEDNADVDDCDYQHRSSMASRYDEEQQRDGGVECHRKIDVDARIVDDASTSWNVEVMSDKEDDSLEEVESFHNDVIAVHHSLA
jgi:hypothetical protein